jgi:branched-chain amino acid transport system substrate-binding protein
MEEASVKSTDITDPGSVVAANPAAEDFGGTVLGRSMHIVVGDHQGKPDLASIIVTRGLDYDRFGAIVDVAIAPVTLAIQFVGKQARKDELWKNWRKVSRLLRPRFGTR